MVRLYKEKLYDTHATSAVTHQSPISNSGFFSTLAKPIHYITALFAPFIPEADDSQPLIKNEYSAKSDTAWRKVVKVALMVFAIQQTASSLLQPLSNGTALPMHEIIIGGVGVWVRRVRQWKFQSNV